MTQRAAASADFLMKCAYQRNGRRRMGIDRN
jgi:hypothetical protein